MVVCLVAHKKTPVLCFWYVAWKDHQLVFYPLCSLSCSLLCQPMHGSSLHSQLMPSAPQPDHTNQGTLLMVTCRPRASDSPSLEPWQCQYLPACCRTHRLFRGNPTDTHKKTNGVDTKAWKMVQLLKFLLVLILKTRAVFFLLLSYAQSYIYISQVNSVFI